MKHQYYFCRKFGFTLAEVFHSASWSRKIAFTLAEVLITLGIIGIVAVLTVPQLIQNYQKKVWVAQLKKSMAVVENGFRMAIAKDEVETLSETELWKKHITDTSNTIVGPDFLRDLGKYISLSDKCMDVTDTRSNIECNFFYRGVRGGSQLKKLNGKEPATTSSVARERIVFLNNGTMLGIDYFSNPQIREDYRRNITMHGGKLFESVGAITIDVNGNQKPNQFGRDIFTFLLGNDGRLYTPNGKDGIIYSYFRGQSTPILNHEQLVDQNCPNFEPVKSACGAGQPDGELAREQAKFKCDKTLTGYYGYYDIGSNYVADACAEKIISEGWEMNY